MGLVYPKQGLRFAIALIFSILVWAGLGVLLKWALPAVVLVFVLIYLLGRSASIALLRGNAVRVGALQLPELNAHLLAACRRLKLDAPPELYLLRSPTVFKAQAVRFLGRGYVILPAGLIEALESQPAALDFHIGRELGRLHATRAPWKPLLLPALMLPLLGPALARAWEYTCDRHGLAASENPAHAKVALAAIAGGRDWKRINLRSYEEQAQQTRGFWMAYHELTRDTPWLIKRFAALSMLAEGQEPAFPMRNPLAYLPALLTPRMPGDGMMSALMTVAAISMLAVAAVPAYHDYLQRSAVAAAYEAAAPMQKAVEKLSALQLRLPAAEELGIGPAEWLRGSIRAHIEPMDDGQIRFDFQGGGFKGESLVLFPLTLEGNPRALEWHCSGTLAVGNRPAGCIWSDQAPEPETPLAADSAPTPAAVAPAAAAGELQPVPGSNPVAQAAFNRRMLSNAFNMVDRIKALEQEFHQRKKRWPTSLDEIGFQQVRVALDHASSVLARPDLDKNGRINLLIEGGAFNGRTLGFKPRYNGYDYTWSCSSGGIPADDLPAGCR